MEKYLVQEWRYDRDIYAAYRKRKNDPWATAEILNGACDGFCEVFDTLEEANTAAQNNWNRLSEYDKRRSMVEVLTVTEDDIFDWAIDDETGAIDWIYYEDARTPKGALSFSGLRHADVYGAEEDDND